MRVEFVKLERHGQARCHWEAVRGKRTRVPGTTMVAGKDIPHDLAQYVIEAAAHYRNGCWGLVAQGATFKSTGRRRTKPGRALIATHRQELAGAEQLAGLHMGAWKAGHASAVATALDGAAAQWRTLQPGQALVFDWPCATARVEVTAGRQSA